MADSLAAPLWAGKSTDWEAWDERVVRAPRGDMHQCTWWAAPLAEHGIVSHLITYGPTENELWGGALFRQMPLPIPGLCVLQCQHGPIALADRNHDLVPPLVFRDAVARLAKETRAAAVSFTDVPDPATLSTLATLFESRVRRIPDRRRAVVDLAGRSMVEIRESYRRRTRRSIKKALAHGIRVERLTAPARLKEAYDAWQATALRKGFLHSRPWASLEPVVVESIKRDQGAVLGAVREGRVVASIWVTFIGRVAVYVYGGFHLHAAASSPGHILHDVAMEDAHARGLDIYDMGLLKADGSRGLSGIDDFKLNFGARVEPLPDRLIWGRVPCASHLLGLPVSSRLDRRLRELWGRRLLARQVRRSGRRT